MSVVPVSRNQGRVFTVALAAILLVQAWYVASRMSTAAMLASLPPPASPAPRGAELPPRRTMADPALVPIAVQPWPEVVAAMLRLPGGLAITPAQRKSMEPTVRWMAAVADDPRTRPGVVLAAATYVLRSDQVAHIVAHRMEPPPPPPPGSGVEDMVLTLLRRRAAEPDAAPGEAAPLTEEPGSVAVEDLMRGLARLEAEPALALTPRQARVLVKPIALAVVNKRHLERAKADLLALLTPAQRDRLPALHRDVMREGIAGISPLQLLEQQ